MCCVERVRNLDGKRKDQFGVQWPTTNAMLKGQSIQEFHGDERFAMLVVNFVDGANVGVIQGGCCLGFRCV